MRKAYSGGSMKNNKLMAFVAGVTLFPLIAACDTPTNTNTNANANMTVSNANANANVNNNANVNANANG